MVPVTAVIIQLVWVPAVLICADIRAEIMYEMSPVTCVSPVAVSQPHKAHLLPRFVGKSSSRANREAIWALEELFTRLCSRWGRESHCISGRLPG